MRRWLFLLLSLSLVGCVTAPSTQPVVRPLLAEQKPFVLNGRLAIKHGTERSSSNLRWTHHADEDEMLLLAPFGHTVARIYSDSHEVVLDTADKHYTAHNTAELTEQVLGWYLPLDGLRYWVLALPAPESEARIERDANGQLSIMRQDGWDIYYSRYTALTSDGLPQRISVQRDGLELLLLIDEWEIH